MRKYSLIFWLCIVILILAIIVAGRYFQWLDFDWKLWTIFGLAALSTYGLGAYIVSWCGFDLYKGR